MVLLIGILSILLFLAVRRRFPPLRVVASDGQTVERPFGWGAYCATNALVTGLGVLVQQFADREHAMMPLGPALAFSILSIGAGVGLLQLRRFGVLLLLASWPAPLVFARPIAFDPNFRWLIGALLVFLAVNVVYFGKRWPALR